MFLRFSSVCVISLLCTFGKSVISEPNIYPVNAGDTKVCCSSMEKMNDLPPIYCYPGNEKSVLNVFQTITVDLKIGKTDDFIIYQGVDHRDVEEQMRSDESAISLNKIISFFWKQKDFRLDPFSPSCFSIKTNAEFKISLHSVEFDSKRLAMFLIGLFFFGYSSRLSHNSLFYYLCGISIGVTASLFVIILFIGRLIPKKKFMVGFFGASSMLSLYAIQILVENLQMILMLYYKYILGYIVFSILVSFVVCYRYGPVTNPRSIDLIRWTLQLIGLALVTLCSFHLEAMVFVDILSILFYYTNIASPYKLLPKKKPKLRLLSEDEYIQQAMIETPKALEELQSFCNSPNCDAWKVISRLRDPKKFAMFMETSTHISSEAVEEHENEYNSDESENEESDDNNDSFDDDIKQLSSSVTSDSD